MMRWLMIWSFEEWDFCIDTYGLTLHRTMFNDASGKTPSDVSQYSNLLAT